jgi:hypothetical protein
MSNWAALLISVCAAVGLGVIVAVFRGWRQTYENPAFDVETGRMRREENVG